MIRELCPFCERITDVTLLPKIESLPVMGEPVEYEAHVLKTSKIPEAQIIGAHYGPVPYSYDTLQTLQ